MKKPLLFICCWVIAMNCSTGKTSRAGTTQLVQEGIAGYIYEETGNRMPMPGVEPKKPKGLSTTIYVYELTNLKQVSRVDITPFYTAILTRPIATAHSDSTGAFILRLAPGRYSLFVKLDGRFYANDFDAHNNIAPVRVQKGRLSTVSFTVNPTAVY